MTEKNHDATKPMPEQLAYANLLQAGALVGILLMMVTYFIYATGILSPHIPMDMVAQNWGKGVNDFMHSTGAPQGWSWLYLLGTGDYLNFIGLALLALLTIPCYLILLPGYFKQKDYVYATICIAEVLVLTLAASGLLGSGGH